MRASTSSLLKIGSSLRRTVAFGVAAPEASLLLQSMLSTPFCSIPTSCGGFFLCDDLIGVVLDEDSVWLRSQLG